MSKLSSFEFFTIANGCKGLLVGAKCFKATFNNGYHGIALIDKYGTEKQIIDKSWSDYSEQVRQLNNLLISEEY